MLKKPALLPYGRQSVGDDDVSAVARVLKSLFLTQGPAVEAFERTLCAYTGAKYCVAVSNGTAALHLAVAALQVRRGCSGVTSPITFLASANALVYNGLIPIFADIDPVTVNVAPEALRRAIRRDAKVIIPVHFAGRPAAMKEIAVIAGKKGCRVIEDAAHAIGSRYPDGGRVGNCRYSDMTIFSFHPVKTITSGEGGAVMTNDKKLYDRLRLLRSHGVTRDPGSMGQEPGPWYYEMQALGFNYRLTDIQAALGSSQLKKIGSFIARRAEIVAAYNKAFRGLEWLAPVCVDDGRVAYHLYVIRADFKEVGLSRRECMARFARNGVGTQVHYIPVHYQPYYRDHFKTRKGMFPEAEKYYEECLSLPLFPAMTDKDVRRVVQAVKGLNASQGGRA